jgi:hypothetical protein
MFFVGEIGLGWFSGALKKGVLFGHSSPVLVMLFRCVSEHAMQKASRAVAGGSNARCNGTTVVTQVRNCPFFVTSNCGVDSTELYVMLVKKMVWGARIAPHPYEKVPIYVMYHLELAAARMHPKGEDLSNIECDYCSIFVGLSLATLREEQANCSEITSEQHLVEGCFAGISDREKSNEPQKMVSRPFLMPQRGLLPGESGEKKVECLFHGRHKASPTRGNSLARTRRLLRRPGWRFQNVPSTHGQEMRSRKFPCPYLQGGERAGGPTVALWSVFLAQVPAQHWQIEQARQHQVLHWPTALFFLRDDVVYWYLIQ